MELNHPPWTSTDHYNHHHHHQAADNVRSFKCSFCKRGFSNAQALGGHMNIHRKDRAKLRQLSDPHDHDHHDNDEVHIQQDHQEHSYNRIRRIKRSNNKGIENHQFQQQMPLFIEASQRASSGCSGQRSVEDYDDEVGGMFPELDLELRLGPEPACLGTRNFF